MTFGKAKASMGRINEIITGEGMCRSLWLGTNRHRFIVTWQAVSALCNHQSSITFTNDLASIIDTCDQQDLDFADFTREVNHEAVAAGVSSLHTIYISLLKFSSHPISSLAGYEWWIVQGWILFFFAGSNFQFCILLSWVQSQLWPDISSFM